MFSTSIAFGWAFVTRSIPRAFACFVPGSLDATLFVDPQSRGTGSRNEFGAPDDVIFSLGDIVRGITIDVFSVTHEIF